MRAILTLSTLTACMASPTTFVNYRAAAVDRGSLPVRAGSLAVNAFLPVGVVPEIGAGDLGMETTFLDHAGTVVGAILVQSEVHGLLSTNANTMHRIGRQTGEFMVRNFTGDAGSEGSHRTVPLEPADTFNLSPEKARAELSALAPLIGIWDMQYEIEPAGSPQLHSRAIEVDRWEAGSRIFFQFMETQDTPETLFRCNVMVWDPMARGLRLFAMDSSFGAHESREVTLKSKEQTVRVVCTEPSHITETVDVFADEGRSRKGTREVWSGDHRRLLLRIRSEGHKRPAAATAPAG